MRASCLLLIVGLTVAPVVAGACDFAAVAVVRSSASVGGVRLAFGQADDARHPKAWLGPLTISVGSAPACTVSDDVSIIERPVMLGRGVVYVSTYSGSQNHLYAVDLKSCRITWRSGSFQGAARFHGDRLTLGGKRVLLDRNCHPVRGMAGGH